MSPKLRDRYYVKVDSSDLPEASLVILGLDRYWDFFVPQELNSNPIIIQGNVVML